MGELISVTMLVVVLGFAVVRPRGLPEAVAAVPAALVILLTGALGWDRAWAEIEQLFPVVAFLAAVLVISELCDADGLFRYAGALMAARSKGDPHRLLVFVFVLAAVVTAVLSLDATVVLLTPVVFATASRMGVRPKPHAYACTHLANAGSLLLPNNDRYVLGDWVVSLGRLPECDITITDSNVSRRHAEIRPRGDGFVLIDLGSTNGSRVNGVRVAERELVDGDELTFGNTRMVFQAS